MTETVDEDFLPIATRIRESLGQQGFMAHMGAELTELARGLVHARRRPAAGAVCSNTGCSTAGSPRSWWTMRPPSPRRRRAASPRSRRSINWTCCRPRRAAG